MKVYPDGKVGQETERIGYGELDNFNILKQATSYLNFPMSITVGPPQSSSTYRGFIGTCAAGTKLDYVVKVYINVLTAFNYVPVTQGTVVVTCPASTSLVGVPP